MPRNRLRDAKGIRSLASISQELCLIPQVVMRFICVLSGLMSVFCKYAIKIAKWLLRVKV